VLCYCHSSELTGFEYVFRSLCAFFLQVLWATKFLLIMQGSLRTCNKIACEERK